jgi:hypothetical protein
MRITPRMKQVLEAADLKYGEVNDVSWSTWRGLKMRGLVVHTANRRSYTTRHGAFPRYHRILLTEAGIDAARGLQGLTPLPTPAPSVRFTGFAGYPSN